jgi:hypothetical protein
VRLVRERDAPHERQQDHGTDDADREPDRHLHGELLHDRPKARALVGREASIPIIRAIPTGSFAPDSPSRIVPVRPPISRLPRTENITAGSVGARAAPRIPAVVQPKSKSECATRAIAPAVRERPEHPVDGDRHR